MERQQRVVDAGTKVFGADNVNSLEERLLRFGEEANELLQAAGWTREQAHAAVDYVFDRGRGELFQEIAGAGVTLYALAHAAAFDLDKLVDTETARILDKADQCRTKHAAKPADMRKAA